LLALTTERTEVGTQAQRLPPEHTDRAPRKHFGLRARPATTGIAVTRLVDAIGRIRFARTCYAARRHLAGQSLEVAIVGGSVQLVKDYKVIRVHPIRHDRDKELGAFANPKGRLHRRAAGN
jgi:hypothetical protein